MLNCSLAKWSDYASDWYKERAEDVRHPAIVDRKQWEVICLLQALKERDMIQPGKRGLVFGVGQEITVSFLAGNGCEILATDMFPDNEKAKLWNESNQWCDTLDKLKYNNLISDDNFDRLVKFRHVDMNNLPDDLGEFDFCWSLCALEHLGSSQNGMDFVTNSIKYLKPGGVAFHTTEFDIDPDYPKYETVDNVFYKETDIEDLVRLIEDQGYIVEPRDYSLGNHLKDYPVRDFGYNGRLKLFSGNSNLVTSIRLIIRRPN
jgi:2-polyprenyl-3-methyl-5-hydroxy-6-metoxy-1,4-benzoquinol methylase